MSNVVWKLRVNHGRQIWEPVEGESNTSLEKHLLTKESNNPQSTYHNEEPIHASLKSAIEEACRFYSSIQTEDGHWAGDYGGPLFLLPGMIIASYIMGIMDQFHPAYFQEMSRYIKSKQNSDGGWGLHIEHHSTVFGTCLNYISLRLLGVHIDDGACQSARSFLHSHNGPLDCPQWGKFYMCALNIMDWQCCDPVPPECWLLPSWVPYLQPGKWWCHCRVVYLAMTYIYGKHCSIPENDLIRSLRQEIYPPKEPYESANWSHWRSIVNPLDNYYPAHWSWKTLSWLFVNFYERFVTLGVPVFTHLRDWACREALDHVKHEDITTKFICIGPVNKVINMLTCYFAEGMSDHTQKHIPRLYDYLWLSDDGMKFQGYNGSQLWDTAFASQAIISCGPEIYEKIPTVKEALKNAKHYIDMTQVLENVDNMKKYYRHISDGAWPFSTLDHGWPISDCTAEGLKATLQFRNVEFLDNHISEERLYKAVNVILSMRNEKRGFDLSLIAKAVDRLLGAKKSFDSGGWATYELTRTSPIIEMLNPAALYGDIMIDYTHTECTSACIQALVMFREKFPNHRREQIDLAIKEAVECIRSRQDKDGGWYGAWAICFCYGGWFGIGAICSAVKGASYETDETVRRGCDFLVSKQLPDGGWGESYLSSERREYVSNHRSQVVNTSWVLLALMAAKYPHKQVLERGIRLLRCRQMENGDFPQENISGVFNMNAMITYTNYRNIFPIWALGTYFQQYGE